MPMQEYYVYMMTGRSGVFYTGMTNHIVRRVVEHREGQCAFTSRYRLHRLVYFDSTSDVREAIAFEKRLKRWPRAKKIALIKRSNPRFLDLAETVLGLPPLISGADAPPTRPLRSGDPDAPLAAVGMTEAIVRSLSARRPAGSRAIRTSASPASSRPSGSRLTSHSRILHTRRNGPIQKEEHHG